MTCTSQNEPSAVIRRGFWGARPLFFRWDGELTASQHIAFLDFSKMGTLITTQRNFEIGREYTRKSQKGYPYATLKGTNPPTLSFRFGYHGSPLMTTATLAIKEPGLYVTLGDLGVVKFRSIDCRDLKTSNSQARFIGDPILEDRFARTLQGQCYNPRVNLFQKIDSKIYAYEDGTGILFEEQRLMDIGTISPIRDSDEMGEEGGGPIRAHVRRMDGKTIVMTHWRRAVEGLAMDVIAIPGNGLYMTVTPEIVLRLAPNPAMLFSRIDLIQRYNTVFNAH